MRRAQRPLRRLLSASPTTRWPSLVSLCRKFDRQSCRPAPVPTRTWRARAQSCSAITQAPKAPVVHHSVCSHSARNCAAAGTGVFVRFPSLSLGLGRGKLSFKLSSLFHQSSGVPCRYLIFSPAFTSFATSPLWLPVLLLLWVSQQRNPHLPPKRPFPT